MEDPLEALPIVFDHPLRPGSVTIPAPTEAFDRATRLASRLFRAPVSLVSLVTEDRQIFAAATGLNEPWATQRQTPLSHSFCQYVVATEAPFVVRDSHADVRVRGNGAITDLDVRAYCGVPIADGDGKVIGAFCVIDREERAWTTQDLDDLEDLAELVRAEIRSLRNLEALHAALTDRDNLLSSISHDLRSPLVTAASITASLLENDALDAEARQALLEALNRQLRRSSDLAAGLLTAEGPSSAETFDAGATAHRVVADLSRIATRGRLRLHAPEHHDFVGSEQTLERILHNLIGNALTHAGNDIVVEVRMEPTDHGLVIRVIDDGVGLHDDDAARVFDARVRGSGARPGSGNGLGLHIVRTLARAHGGDIVLRTAVGEGAHFAVTLAHQGLPWVPA